MPIFNQPPSGVAEADEIALANRLIGPFPGGMSKLFWDYGQRLLDARSVFSNGNTVTAFAGGFQVDSTAASGRINQFSLGAETASSTTGIGFRTGQNWYISGRFSIPTAVTAQTDAWMGLATGSGQMMMGIHGATSFANFSLTGTAGSAITHPTAFDNLVHTHRAWRVGGTTFYSIDGVIATGSADIATACGLFWLLQNGTDAVNRSIRLIWQFGACPFL